jgi:hypothetical protein
VRIEKRKSNETSTAAVSSNSTVAAAATTTQAAANNNNINSGNINANDQASDNGSSAAKADNGLIIVELADRDARQLALSNTNRLAQSNEFRKVFVNPDRTLSERTLVKKLREEKIARNNKLPFTEDVNDRVFKYGKFQDGKRWFWGIRGASLVKVIHKDDRN